MSEAGRYVCAKIVNCSNTEATIVPIYSYVRHLVKVDHRLMLSSSVREEKALQVEICKGCVRYIKTSLLSYPSRDSMSKIMFSHDTILATLICSFLIGEAFLDVCLKKRL